MTTPSSRAAGPWVLVVGMHRSNTSALTGMLAGLGLALPPASDLVEGNPDNPVHYESRALIELGDRILLALGGFWDGPPTLAPGWPDDPRVTAFDDEALATLGQIYGTPGPKVWKDPRLCLLLPYWLRLLDDPAPAVFVWRSPAEVADSLHRRDGSTFSHGLALWSAYNRAALNALAGRPVYVVESAQLLDDPTVTAKALAGWLDAQEVDAPADGWDIGAAIGVIAPQLSRRRGADGDVPAEFTTMADRLGTLSGPHAALAPVDLGVDPPWADDVLEVHQRMAHFRYQLVDLDHVTGRLRSDHEELVARFRDLGDANHRLAQDHTAANEELARLRAELAGLRHERDVARTYADRVEVELERIRASASWRITAPLRGLGGRPTPEGEPSP